MQEIVDRLAADDQDAAVARTLILPYLNHAATMHQSGYATADDIDAAMRFGCGYPIGPLALIDAIGSEIVAEGLEAMYAETGDDLHKPATSLRASRVATGSDGGAATPSLRQEIARVGVVGTGTMATGIVEVFAKAGYDVTCVGRTNDKVAAVAARIGKSLDKAISRGKLDEGGKQAVLSRLTGVTSQDELAGVDIVVEAVAEDLSVKLELFGSLDRICKPGAILATTTSSLSVADCAAATARPQDVIGMHFFNPAPVMRLIEVVTTEATSTDVDETTRALCLEIGKHPVSCGDRAGFIVNALLFPYLNDAVKLHDARGGTLGEIDEAMKRTKLPMGPFELLDVVGNDVSLAIEQSLVDEFGHPGWNPAPTLVELVASGHLGRKSGRGFHDYSA